jgi:hypothetical protein
MDRGTCGCFGSFPKEMKRKANQRVDTTPFGHPAFREATFNRTLDCGVYHT